MGRRGPTPNRGPAYVPPKPSVPKTPAHLRDNAYARECWRVIWEDPAARYFTGASRRSVTRLVELYCEHRTLELAAQRGEGELYEALKLKLRLEGPIKALETELALTPFAKNKLGIPLVDPPDDLEDESDDDGPEPPAPPPPAP